MMHEIKLFLVFISTCSSTFVKQIQRSLFIVCFSQEFFSRVLAVICFWGLDHCSIWMLINYFIKYQSVKIHFFPIHSHAVQNRHELWYHFFVLKYLFLLIFNPIFFFLLNLLICRRYLPNYEILNCNIYLSPQILVDKKLIIHVWGCKKIWSNDYFNFTNVY